MGRVNGSCQTGAWTATIAVVPKAAQNDVRGNDQNDLQSPSQLPATPSGNPFHPGAMVILTLGAPREKFWGAILAVTPEGLSLAGIELSSFDDRIAMIKDGEPFSPGVVFFPMHRVERMELDLPDGELPSLTQRFASKTGIDPTTLLARDEAPHPGIRQGRS
jgi:hypothetical protein